MNRRLSFSLTTRVFLAGVVGFGLGTAAAPLLREETLVVLRQTCDLGNTVFLSWMEALAWPLIASSIVLGTVGLEPMRALGKITGKTLAWLAFHGLLAVGVGAGAAFVFPPTEQVGSETTLALSTLSPHDPVRVTASLPVVSSGWIAFVLLCLVLAYYRNQIEEGRGRLFVRLSQGIEEMLTPMVEFTSRVLPWLVFTLLLAFGAQSYPGFFPIQTLVPPYALASLLLGWAVFGLLVLPELLWLSGRIPPWRLFSAVWPAALLAFAGGSVEAAFPLTLHATRRGLHVTNRVAGPTLALGMAFQRDGLALGCTTLLVCHWRETGEVHHWPFYVAELLACWLVAFGGGVVQRTGIVTAALAFGFLNAGTEQLFFHWGLARLVIMSGAALSVFSHVSIATIIAKGEGEFWVPGPPPDPDELQGLKNDLATAES